jgi:protoheme IX farnesyltransferase
MLLFLLVAPHLPRPPDMTSLTVQPSRVAQYWALTKPRVTQLAVFCAIIGMFLATPDLPDWRRVVFATIGIWLLTGAAFAINCLMEREIDSRMARTSRRPMARGEITVLQTLTFSVVIGGMGMWVLYSLVNPLTMWLTLATFVGYAIIYTIILKPATPQNIVIGGLAGAMPPALGWAAIADTVPMQAWILVLIIFIWTPPHFWALAMYRRDDYAKSGLPMLPITHGMEFTKLQIMLYTIALIATTMLPFAVGMSGLIYLATAAVLGVIFFYYSWQIYRHYTDLIARKAFTFSIIYLSILFAVLLVDHYLLFRSF